MPLGFLVPLFLLGLAAIAIPIWAHLTRKNRSLVVPFPSLMFLRAIPFKEDRKRAIHHWLLLALRALVVALLVAAFARPFFRGADAVATVGAGPTETVVLLDRSYSMAAGTRWESARTAAAEAIGALGPLDRISLVAFDQGAEALVRSDADPGRVKAALDTLQPGWGTTRYGPALKLAQSILEGSELPSKALVVVSDFQRRGWTGEEGVRLPAGTTVRTVPIADALGPNVAVADVQLKRDRFSGRERVTPTARLTRTGGEGPVEVSVALDVDGRELQKRTVTLPASGAAAVEFAPLPLGTVHTMGTVRVPADELPRDDARHFVVSQGSALPVRVFTRPGAPAEGSLFLSRALAISSEGAFDVSVRPWNAAVTQELGPGQVAILVDQPFPTGAAGSALQRMVEAGGGLILVSGDVGGWPREIEGWLGARSGATADRMDVGGGRLGWIDYDHPVFQVFRGPRSGDFTSTRFFRQRVVTPLDSTLVLARFDDGSPALLERRIGEGRVLIWASSMDQYWNDLGVQPVFLPFVHQLVRYASGRGETLPWFTAGQVLDISDARAMATAGLLEGTEAPRGLDGERVVTDPRGTPVRLPGGEGPHYLSLTDAGFYTLRSLGEEGEGALAVAVNVDLAESDPTAMEPDEIQAAVAAMVDQGPAGGSGGVVDIRTADIERRQSLWRLLLAAVLVLMAAESLMASQRSSRSATPA